MTGGWKKIIKNGVEYYEYINTVSNPWIYDDIKPEDIYDEYEKNARFARTRNEVVISQNLSYLGYLLLLSFIKNNNSLIIHNTIFFGDKDNIIQNAKFNHVSFTGVILFSNIIFKGPADFTNTNFTKSVCFENVTFEEEADFQQATFNKALFSNVTFLHNVLFTYANFIYFNLQRIFLSKLFFIDNCIIENLILGKITFIDNKGNYLNDEKALKVYIKNLRNTIMETKSSYFNKSEKISVEKYKTEIPRPLKFIARLTYEILFYFNIKNQKTMLKDQIIYPSRKSCSVLKDTYIKQSNHIDSNLFYALEMIAYGEELKSTHYYLQRFVFFISKITSNHGQSILSPIITILIVAGIFSHGVISLYCIYLKLPFFYHFNLSIVNDIFLSITFPLFFKNELTDIKSHLFIFFIILAKIFNSIMYWQLNRAIRKNIKK